MQLTKRPIFWYLLIGFFTSIFVTWFAVTTVPIVMVETRYQAQQLLKNAFGVDTFSQLFFPNLANWNITTHSKNAEFGIVIPAIQLDEPVIFNVDPNDTQAYTAALKKGIAHASSTAFPDSGGVGYYFAHSTSAEFVNQFKAVFYLLGKLKSGDAVYIWHENKKYAYQVTHTAVTEPTDISFLYGTYPTETIVLQTCWPPGTTLQRKLVFAERVEE